MFRRRRFFEGKPIRSGDQVRDIAWLTPAGKEMTPEDWGRGFGKCVAVFLNGEAIPEPNERGERVVDDSFLLCFNAHDQAHGLRRPDTDYAEQWTAALDTADPTGATPSWWSRRARRSRCSRGRCSCCVRPPDRMARPVLSTYRLQLRGDAFTFADAEDLLRLPRRSRGVAPVPVPDPDRGRGLHPRLRRHRPDHGVGGTRAAPTGWPGCRRRREHAAWA